MSFIISLVVGAALFAFALWLSVGILDRGNPQNTWGTALLFGVIFSLPGALGVSGLFGLIPLIALLLILIRFYDMGILRSFVVVILMGLINFGVALLLAPIFLALA